MQDVQHASTEAPHTQVIKAMLQHRAQGLTQEEVSELTSIRNVSSILQRLSDAGIVYDSGNRRKATNQKNSLIVWFVRKDADPNAPLPPRSTVTPATRRRRRTPKRESQKAVSAAVREQFLGCLRTVAVRQHYFTVDDVRIEFDLIGSFEGMDARVCGSVMLQAMKLGLCRKTDRVESSVRRSDGNAAIYESLICSLPKPVEPDTVEGLQAEVTKLRERVRELEQELAQARAH